MPTLTDTDNINYSGLNPEAILAQFDLLPNMTEAEGAEQIKKFAESDFMKETAVMLTKGVKGVLVHGDVEDLICSIMTLVSASYAVGYKSGLDDAAAIGWLVGFSF